MQQTVARSLRAPETAQVAADIVAHVSGRDPAAQIAALRHWLDGRVRFLADPLIDGDVIRSPELLLAQLERTGEIRGDCDDLATFVATLGHAIGIPARFVTLGFEGPTGPFAHVFTELQDQSGRWIEMDVTETPERRAANPPSRRAEWPAYPKGANMAAQLGQLLAGAQLAYVAYTALRDLGDVLREAGIEL